MIVFHPFIGVPYVVLFLGGFSSRFIWEKYGFSICMTLFRSSQNKREEKEEMKDYCGFRGNCAGSSLHAELRCIFWLLHVVLHGWVGDRWGRQGCLSFGFELDAGESVHNGLVPYSLTCTNGFSTVKTVFVKVSGLRVGLIFLTNSVFCFCLSMFLD